MVASGGVERGGAVLDEEELGGVAADERGGGLVTVCVPLSDLEASRTADTIVGMSLLVRISSLSSCLRRLFSWVDPRDEAPLLLPALATAGVFDETGRPLPRREPPRELRVFMAGFVATSVA